MSVPKRYWTTRSALTIDNGPRTIDLLVLVNGPWSIVGGLHERMTMTKPQVLILMGSASDLPVMEEAEKILTEFGIPSEKHVASAHRTPDKVAKLVAEAEGRGIGVIIAGAGYAAHLAGVVAAKTVLPVIGVPLDSSPLQGLDALLSTAQMPGGIPVASMCIGNAGAKNAGIFAAEILALSDQPLKEKLRQFRKKMADQIEERDREINR